MNKIPIGKQIICTKKGIQIMFLILFFIITISNNIVAQKISEVDKQTAEEYSKKYVEDDLLCTSSYQLYTFDKGKNSFKDKVVEVQEQGTYEFMSLKKYSALTYTEYYNNFIQINNFKKEVKYGNKFYSSRLIATDRSVTDEGIFFDDSRVKYFPIRFSQVGEKAKINVKKTFNDGKYFTRIFFNEIYPIKEQVIKFKVPSWLTINFVKMNFEGSKINIEETTKGDNTIYKFTLNEIPSSKTEYRRINRSQTDPHIIFQIKSFEIKGEEYKGFDKVDDVYNWNNRLYEMAANDKEKLKETLTKIVKGKTTDVEKIKAIYYWVQDNIRYIAYEDGYSGFIPTTVQKVISKKYGDCKGMANLLTEFLKLSGYEAHFTWIGTKDIPYSQSTPALCVNNHAICTLNFNGKTYFLDGTENYSPFGENAFRIQDKEALIANGNKFEIKKVPTTTADENKIYTKADLVLDKDKILGKVKVILTGHSRTEFHQDYQILSKKNKLEYLNDYLEFDNDNLVAEKVITSNLDNRDLPVTIEGDIDLSNSVNTISNDKYVGIDFFPKSLERFIPDEKRINGYDLDNIIKFQDEISLTIPANKKFVDKPENLKLSFECYEFNGEYIIVGNKLTLKKELILKKNIIKKAGFDEWKKFIENIKDFNKYLITITQK